MKNNDSKLRDFLVAVLSLIFCSTALAQSDGSIRLDGHMPAPAISRATHLGRMASENQVTLTVALNLKDPAGLAKLISRLHNPGDALFGKFLTPEQFREMYAPAPEDFNAVAQYLSSRGLEIVGSTSNTIQVKGSVGNVESAFNIEMHQYQTQDRRTVFAPNTNPEINSEVSGKISGILGLNNFSNFVAHRQRRASSNSSTGIGTGPNGGLSPSDIQKAYSLSGGNLNGAGQTLALMELDGYTTSDIAGYTRQFNLSNPPVLQNILIDGYDGSAGDGADEVTLDIELMMAVAQGASKILVYEGTNTETGPLDVYAKIADDNIAKQVSTSWGSPESENTSAYLNQENAIFMQMASQGQSIYAASGDSGAYDDGKNLSVDDPASQPYMVATGGTTLSINSDGSYKSESSWGMRGASGNEGGGGGISAIWPIPSWQAGLATSANKGSSSNRMVPDVSLDANPETGYAIYIRSGWNVYGGTSCAAPLWAAYTALINQERASGGLQPLGFANLAVYQAAQSSVAAQLFHDIADQSTNLFFPAVTGFDLSTGWGSWNGVGLASVLSGASSAALAPPTNLSAAPHNQVASMSWSAGSGALSYIVSRSQSAAGPFTPVASNVAGLSYVDVGLQNGTIYYYEVQSQNIASQSAASQMTSVTPVLMAPQAPSGFIVIQN